MPDIQRFRAPLIAVFGVMIAGIAFAGPASAAECNPDGYPVCTSNALLPSTAATQPLASAAAVKATGASAGTNGLAFTGTNALGVAGLGGLLVVGGAGMVLAGKRRKVNE